MSSVYTGVGSNVTQSTSPTETIPSDGDNRNVASVNTAFQKILDYIALIWAGAFTGQTSSSPGLKATAGGGGTPGTGALNLVPQAAPSAPVNGDIWVETTTNVVKARVNSATRQLIDSTTQTPALLPFGINLTAVNYNQNTEYMMYASAAPPANTLGVTPVSDTSVASGNAAYLMPFAGHPGTVQCRTNVAPGAGTYQFKVYKNGTLALTPSGWTGAGTTFTFDASSITFVVGDRIAISVADSNVNNTGLFWSAVAPAYVV